MAGSVRRFVSRVGSWRGPALFRAVVVFSLGLVALGGFVGLVRAPMISNNDEVLINSAALTWAREGRLANRALGRTLDMREVYGHHPPVYLWIQSRVYRWFGFGPYSTRMTSYVFGVLGVAACFVLLRSLSRWGDISHVGASLALLSLACSLVLLRVMRMGRVETAGMFFGLLSLVVAAPPSDGRAAPAARVLGSAVLLALAVGCHLELLLYAPAAFLLWLQHGSERGSMRFARAILGGIFSASVFTLTWLLAAAPHFVQALAQFRRISGAMGKFGQVGRHLWAYAVRNYGAPSLVLTGVVALAALFLVARRFRDLPWRRRALMIGFLAGLGAVLTVIPFDYKRFLVLSPLIYLAGAVCLAELGSEGRRVRLFLSGVFLLHIFTGIVLQAGYLGRCTVQWNQRDPTAYEQVFEGMPGRSRIALEPCLWVAGESLGHHVRVIDLAFAPDEDFWRQHPEALLRFEFVIVRDSHPLDGGLRASRHFQAWRERSVPVVSRPRFTVFRRSAPTPPGAGGAGHNLWNCAPDCAYNGARQDSERPRGGGPHG